MCNMCIMEIPEEEEREEETEEICKIIMTEIALKLMSDAKPKIQNSQSTRQNKCQKKSHTYPGI